MKINWLNYFCYYNEAMQIDFDPDKNAKNILERSLTFEHATEFDFETAQFTIDIRRDYVWQNPHRTLGFLDHHPHALIFVEIARRI